MDDVGVRKILRIFICFFEKFVVQYEEGVAANFFLQYIGMGA